MKNCKKVFIILSILVFFYSINAETYKTLDYLNVRENNNIKSNKLGQIKPYQIIERVDTLDYISIGNLKVCDYFIKIKYQNSFGYVCSGNKGDKYIQKIEDTPLPEIKPIMNEKDWLDFFDLQQFPESYKSQLLELHKLHPNWIFRSIKTIDNFNVTIKNEAVIGRSLININPDKQSGFLSTEQGSYDWSNDKFRAYDGRSWYVANSQSVAHYLDPRNYFNEKEIFVFEDLSYNPTLHTVDTINTYLPEHMKKYANYFIEAGKTFHISPIYLIAKSIAEVGTNPNSTAISGKAGTWNDIDLNGVYNFFNIGAYSGKDNVYYGLKYAKQQGWIDGQDLQVEGPKKAILGGAEFLSKSYIYRNQNTNYSQKFNVHYNRMTGYSHQYMTDIRGASNVAYQTYNKYASSNRLNSNISFLIPVYDGLPPLPVPMPDARNPNNWLKYITINDSTISNFAGDITTYNLNYNNVESINIKAKPVNNKSRIENLGEHKLKEGLNTIEIKVTAENDNVKSYILNIKVERDKEKTNPPLPNPNLPKKYEDLLRESNYQIQNNIISNIGLNLNTQSFINSFNSSLNTRVLNSDKSLKTSGKISTGDILHHHYLNTDYYYQLLIYGDMNGDGNISLIDLLKLQKHLMNYKPLNGIYYQAGDINHDGKLSLIDLLRIQKHLMNIKYIEQK